MKTIITEILNGDIVVARNSKENPELIESTGTGLELPMNLFYGRDYVRWHEYIDWLKTRAFPEERCGADELLEQMGLKEYNPIKIARITGARMAQDNFSVRHI